MIHLLNIEEWAERYKNGSISIEEMKILHNALDQDSVLNTEFQKSLELQFLLNDKKAHLDLRNTLGQIAHDHQSEHTVGSHRESKKISFIAQMRKYWKPLSAAAAIALMSSLVTYNFTKDNKSKNAQYTLLKRDIEKIKLSQNQLISTIKQPTNPGNFGGSGFAISNDGYIATNYHVVEAADSVYIQLNNGDFQRATILSADPTADIAILKIDDNTFKFGKSLPYAIKKSVSPLGQKVFTIGYPKDDVVYNEGYISSEKGYNGDTAAYQLEITSNPGQSGAPVIDNSGNIIGIITGKQSNTNGMTFAVHSNLLLKAINELPEEHRLNLNNHAKLPQNRSEQIKTLRDYVCAVRVYK